MKVFAALIFAAELKTKMFNQMHMMCCCKLLPQEVAFMSLRR